MLRRQTFVHTLWANVCHLTETHLRVGENVSLYADFNHLLLISHEEDI